MAAETTTKTARTTVLIAHLARMTSHRFEAALAPLGLRKRQVVALSFLRDRGPAPQQALGEALSIEPNNVVILLNELEEAGFAVRRRDHADRRRHIVAISPDGERALADAGRALDAIEDEVLAALSPDERGTLHDLLDAALEGRLPPCSAEPIGLAPPGSDT